VAIPTLFGDGDTQTNVISVTNGDIITFGSDGDGVCTFKDVAIFAV